MADNQNTSKHFCSFCGKDEKQVKMLIKGPSELFICNDCIDICYKLKTEGLKINIKQEANFMSIQKAYEYAKEVYAEIGVEAGAVQQPHHAVDCICHGD